MTTIGLPSGLQPATSPDGPADVDNECLQIAALARMVRLQDRALLRSARQREALTAELAQIRSKLERADADRVVLLERARAQDEQIAGMIASRSWRLTAPLRGVVRLLSGRVRA